MSVAHLRRNSSPHIATAAAAAALQRGATPPRKISQPARIALNNNVELCCSDDETKEQGSSSLLLACANPATSSTSSSSEDGDAIPPESVSAKIYKRFLSRCDDLPALTRSITEEARKLVHAEACSLFLLDYSARELVAEMRCSDGSFSEMRLPMEMGVVGRVAATLATMNVKQAERCSYFYPKIDEATGFRTRNLLCFPVIDRSGSLLGVVEACNRIGRSAFTRHDERCAATLAVYAATAIQQCLLIGEVREAQRRSHMAAEYLVQGSQLLVSPEEVRRLATAPIPPTSAFNPAFASFSFVPRSIGNNDRFVDASIAIFNELGFISLYGIPRKQLAAFVLRVARGYRDVPYHNWSHAFAVAHYCFVLLRTPVARSHLDELERLALIVSSLCHDIDHRGTSNSFQKQARTPLAQLYSSEGSVLERHHYAQTAQILAKEECAILSQLTRSQYNQVLSHIREIILATDIAMHLGKVSEMRELVRGGFDRSNRRNHYILTCLFMTASDLSDQTKHFANCKCIAENIYTEFFSQGDLEKQMGSLPMEMMDRDRACVPRIQIDFIDTVAMPVFDMLSEVVPDSLPSFHSLLYNRRCWISLDSIFKERGVRANGLEYLRDESLEKEVVERVERSPMSPAQEEFAHDGHGHKSLLQLDWKPLSVDKFTVGKPSNGLS